MALTYFAGRIIRGLSGDSKPTNANVPTGTLFIETDTGTMFVNDGVDWVQTTGAPIDLDTATGVISVSPASNSSVYVSMVDESTSTNATETNVDSQCKFDQTVTEYSVTISANTSDSNTRCRVRINAANMHEGIVGAGLTGEFTFDTGGAFAKDDLVNYQVNRPIAAGSVTITGFTITKSATIRDIVMQGVGEFA